MIYVFIFILFVCLFILFFWSRRYINPYRLYMVFGRKGSGKTTYMVKIAYKYHKMGWNVYSNADIPFAYPIDISQLGLVVPPPHSVLLVDEVGMIWDNRQFKNFRNDVRDYFKLQRHYQNIVYLFSQTFDIDIKLRNLTDAMYLCTSPIPILSIVRRIKRTIVLVQPSPEAEGRISDSLEFIPFFMNLFGYKALQFTFIPRWAKYFDSHEVPELPMWPSRDLPPISKRKKKFLRFIYRIKFFFSRFKRKRKKNKAAGL